MRSVTRAPSLPCPCQPRPTPVAAGLRAGAARLARAGMALLAVPAVLAATPAAAAAAAAPVPTPTAADAGLPGSPQLAEAIAEVARQALGAAGLDATRQPRVEVQLGRLDPRLKLAPCADVRPFWPSGQRLLGQARVGLRCDAGPTRWQVYLPVAIRAWAPAPVAATDLPAGTVLAAEHLRPGEADLLARADAVVDNAGFALGRALARPLVAGQALRRDDLRLRQWVRPGDTVRVLASAGGFQVSAEARALAPAMEGQPVRVRTDSGRILQGVATGERQVTVPL